MSKRTIGLFVVGAAIAARAWWLWPREAARQREAADPGARGGGGLRAQADGADAARGGIDGAVLDPGGAPIAGAVVRVARGDDDAATAVAGADGRFAIDVAPGTWTVVATAPGRVPGEATAEVARGARASVELRLAAGGANVRGEVVDATGGPVEGAFVVFAPEQGVLDADARRGAAAVSGADGRFELGLVPGRWRVTTSHPEYVGDTRGLDVGPDGASVAIRLVPGGVIEGVVRDRGSGEPVGGAEVAYAREVVAAGGPLRRRGAEQRERGRVTAGADGRFRITGLGAGRIVLDAVAPSRGGDPAGSAGGAGGASPRWSDDRASAEPSEVLLGIAETATDVEVWVAPALSIRGRVAYEDGAPAAGAAVTVGARGEMQMVTAEADGTFRAGGVRPGRYLLTASADDALPGDPVTVEVRGAPVTDVALTVRRGAFVTGRVEPPGVAEVTVIEDAPDDDFAAMPGPGMMRLALGGPAVRTGADGSFRIGPFEPGPVRLGARAADGRRGEADVAVAATGAAGVVIALEARGSIRGRVATAAGAPVTSAVVTLRRRGTGRTTIVNGVDVGAERAPTDAQGRFAIAGLDAGSYELGVLDDLGAPMAIAGGEPVTVELAANQAKDGVAITVEANDGAIEGVVVGPDGAPVADAWVTVASAIDPLAELDRRGESRVMIAVVDEGGGRRAGEIPPVLTGDDGRFAVRGLRRGTYRVQAEGLQGGARGAIDGVTTGSDVTVTLARLARIVGTVTIAGAPVTDYVVVATGPTEKRRDVHDDEGEFTLAGLEPGSYQVEARTPRGNGRATVTVEAGKDATVAIAVEAPGTITGTVVDEAGAPIAGRMVLVTPRQAAGEMRIELDAPPPTTGADGAFSVDSDAGARTLIVMGPQGPVVRKDVDVVGGKTLALGTLTAEAAPGP